MTRLTRLPRLTQPHVPILLSLALLLAALLVPAAPAALAQEEPTERFEEEVDVTEVLLDVIVTDSSGQIVAGLDEDDFVVREDGEPVELTDVTFYGHGPLSASASTSGAAAPAERSPDDRYFILMFHDPGVDFDRLTGPGQVLEAAREARRWASEELLPTDWVAVVSYDYKLKVQQDFTRDRRAITEAINQAVRRKDPSGGNWPSRIDPTAGPSLRAHLPQGKELRRETKLVYDALEQVAEASGHIRARKNVILLSRGFGRLDTFGQYTPDPRYFPPMARALNDNNVAVYTVDLTPIEVDHALADSLSHLAIETGGQYYETFTNFIVPLRRIAEENAGYYLLTYRSRHPADDDGYQEVKVEVKDPDLDVRARAGYLYGPPGVQTAEGN